MSDSNRLPRLVPLAGVLFAVLTVAGYFAIGKFPDTDASISKLTSFYAAPVCSVSRAQLLTGCYGAGVRARRLLPRRHARPQPQ